MELHQGDALAYLRESRTVFDAIYSVFGAGWFSAPGLLLPVVHVNLRPGGVFAMSQRPPIEGCYGCQASYIPRGPDEDPAVVKRWDHEPDVWALILKEHGYVDVSASVIAAPRVPGAPRAHCSSGASGAATSSRWRRTEAGEPPADTAQTGEYAPLPVVVSGVSGVSGAGPGRSRADHAASTTCRTDSP